ncbi:AAA family ATPase [Lutibacter sp.]|uniref:ATP-dependent DNA helicase n=1 Tax=Lutibacter sp. TaxID=1925666 RepID=UPI001A2839F6|nr:AAA family ATPase [Lutibacter sp.]MBI9042808.1 AAA family ATPase [Lutibacter sp.]
MLTNDQNIALNKIKEFITDDSSQIFILKGYAGTGKTFLIGEIAKHLRLMHLNYHLAAPTGRASRMLNERTGLEASTIHKLLYTQSKIDLGDDEETDDLIFNFAVKNNNQESINDVFILDESSMISDSKSNDEEFLRFGSGRLLYDLLEFVGFNSNVHIPNLRRKIIFIGDPAQLPPIGNNFSFALSQQYLTKEYSLLVEEYTLKEVVRQTEESGILTAASKIRNSIEKSEYNNFDINNDVNIITKRSQLKQALANNLNDSIYITYSNEDALKANLYIRNSFITTKEREILPEEKLIVVANNYHIGSMNGDFIKTVEVWSPVEHTINLRGRKEPIKLSFREMTIKYIGENNEEIEKEVFILENLLWSEQRNLGRDELVALRVFAAQELGVKFPHKTLKKTNPGQYKKEKELYIEELKNSKYYNALQVKFGYAVTCHKAQGGEWNNVFVKFDGFSGTQNESFYRWAYTAITRAKENLFAINPPKFSPWSKMISTIDAEPQIIEESKNIDTNNCEIPSFITNPIAQNIYLKVFSIIENEEIEIIKVEQLDWRLRFVLSIDDEHIHIDFIYKKNGKITTNIFQFSSEKSKESINELFSNLTDVSAFEKKMNKLTFDEPFLEDFYSYIKKIFENTEIEITEIKPISNGQKYYFKTDTEYCDIIFYYDSKKVFSKKGPFVEKYSSVEFKNRCLNIISGG